MLLHPHRNYRHTVKLLNALDKLLHVTERQPPPPPPYLYGSSSSSIGACASVTDSPSDSAAENGSPARALTPELTLEQLLGPTRGYKPAVDSRYSRSSTLSSQSSSSLQSPLGTYDGLDMYDDGGGGGSGYAPLSLSQQDAVSFSGVGGEMGDRDGGFDHDGEQQHQPLQHRDGHPPPPPPPQSMLVDMDEDADSPTPLAALPSSSSSSAGGGGSSLSSPPSLWGHAGGDGTTLSGLGGGGGGGGGSLKAFLTAARPAAEPASVETWDDEADGVGAVGSSSSRAFQHRYGGAGAGGEREYVPRSPSPPPEDAVEDEGGALPSPKVDQPHGGTSIPVDSAQALHTFSAGTTTTASGFLDEVGRGAAQETADADGDGEAAAHGPPSLPAEGVVVPLSSDALPDGAGSGALPVDGSSHLGRRQRDEEGVEGEEGGQSPSKRLRAV